MSNRDGERMSEERKALVSLRKSVINAARGLQKGISMSAWCMEARQVWRAVKVKVESRGREHAKEHLWST